MRRDGDRSRATLIAVGAGCVVLIAVLYVVAVRTGWGQRVDESAVRHHLYDRTPGRDAHRYDRGLIVVLAALGLGVAALALPRWRLLLVLGGSIATAVVVANVLRRLVLGRPHFVFDSLYGPSFPSGHAAAAVTIAASLLVVCPGPRWARRVLAILIAGSVDGLILFIPIHRPSDIAAGNLLGLAVLCVAMGVFGTDLRLPPSAADRVESGWRRLGTFLGLAGADVVVMLLVMSRLAHRSDLSLRAYGAGFPLGVLVDVLTAGVVLAAFEVLVSRTDAVRTPGLGGGF